MKAKSSIPVSSVNRTGSTRANSTAGEPLSHRRALLSALVIPIGSFGQLATHLDSSRPGSHEPKTCAAANGIGGGPPASARQRSWSEPIPLVSQDVLYAD